MPSTNHESSGAPATPQGDGFPGADVGTARTLEGPTPSRFDDAEGRSLGEAFVRQRVKSRLFGGAPPQIGRFIVLEALGSGGMGTVYAAYDDKLDRKIAIKLLHRAGPEFDERLVSEARAIARVEHPNVVAVHDVGEHEGRVYIAMEFVRGEDLRRWLARPRSWRDTLEVFAQAGKGLAAAHAVGVLHRDFKPENVLRSENGRVCVADFGLALTAHETIATQTSDTDARAYTPTTGIAGTPLYMPLEQLRGEPVDARSDQHAFCASLFEALYGERPFAGSDLRELEVALTEGRVAEAPAGDVPRWLRAIVVRGLARRPDERWPSMSDLLGAIDARLRPRRRTWVVALGTGSVAALATAGALWAVPRAPTCDGAEASIERDFTSRRDEAASAFVTAAPGYGADAWMRVDARLSDFADAWQTTSRDFCEATHVRGEQSLERLDRRMACMERRWRRLSKLMDLFTHADAAVVERAFAAAEAIPSPASCAEEDEPVGELPTDPSLAGRAQEIRLRIEEAEALQALGRMADSRDVAEAAVADADALDHLPTRARATARLGEVTLAQGDFNTARDRLRDAYLLAQEAGLDRLSSMIANDLTAAISRGEHDLDEALLWSDLAAVSLRRLPDGATPEQWATHERLVASAYQAVGKNDEAIERMGRAIESEERLSTERLGLAASLNNYGVMLHAGGRGDEALAVLRRAIALREELQGPDHPMTIQTTNGMVAVLKATGRHDEALELADALLERVRRALGPTDSNTLVVLGTRSSLLGTMGRYDEALADHAEALRLLAESAPESLAVAAELTNRSFVLHRLNRLEEARADLERALRIIETKAPNDRTRISIVVGNLGSLSSALGDYDKAVEQLERARALLMDDASRSPHLVRTENNLATALMRLDRHAEALEVLDVALERLLAVEPPNRFEVGKVRRNRGSALLSLHRVDEARAELLVAIDDLQADPRETFPLAEAYRNLAHVEWERGAPRPDVERAVNLALAAFETSPSIVDAEAEALRTWWRTRPSRR